MTQNEMKTFQLILKEKGAEMTKALRNREGIIIEKAADELDEIATAFERDIAVQKLDRESRLLRQILGALFRIENGTLERACTVMRKSAGSVWRRCPGRPSAWPARKRPIGATSECLR
jgi:hypothetical protein